MDEPRGDTGIDRRVGYRVESFPSGRSRLVAAHFNDLDDAVEATRFLEERGYARDSIAVFMSTERHRQLVRTRPEFESDGEGAAVVENVELKKESKTMEGAGTGGAIGGGLGAVGAAVAAVGTTLVVPPLGITVAGPLAAGLAGGGAGAAAGGLVGALAGAGMSEYRAKRFHDLLNAGHLIVGVEAETEAERSDLEERLEDLGGTVVREEQKQKV